MLTAAGVDMDEAGEEVALGGEGGEDVGGRGIRLPDSGCLVRPVEVRLPTLAAEVVAQYRNLPTDSATCYLPGHLRGVRVMLEKLTTVRVEELMALAQPVPSARRVQVSLLSSTLQIN